MFDLTIKTSDFGTLVVTHECNKKCPFCVDDYRGRLEYITLNNVIRACKVAKKANLSDMLIVGGEPTLHPDIVQIARIVKSFGFRVIMTTNYSKPHIVADLDGIVDCFNISYYYQKTLPLQKDFLSDLTLHTLIHNKQLQSKDKLDSFIDTHKSVGHLKFSTLTVCNDWTKRRQCVEYLDTLKGAESVTLFEEIGGLLYRNCIIKRHDRVLKDNAEQSLKFHVDGHINTSWERDNITCNN